jgi:hypothetical protein
MDQLIASPSETGLQAFQSKQEQLMGQWAAKLGLPPISPEEHNLMQTQLHKMFDQLANMPKSDIQQLREKHTQIKAMMATAASA